MKNIHYVYFGIRGGGRGGGEEGKIYDENQYAKTQFLDQHQYIT